MSFIPLSEIVVNGFLEVARLGNFGLQSPPGTRFGTLEALGDTCDPANEGHQKSGQRNCYENDVAVAVHYGVIHRRLPALPFACV
jgi:hypothetical protein